MQNGETCGNGHPALTLPALPNRPCPCHPVAHPVAPIKRHPARYTTLSPFPVDNSVNSPAFPLPDNPLHPLPVKQAFTCHSTRRPRHLPPAFTAFTAFTAFPVFPVFPAFCQKNPDFLLRPETIAHHPAIGKARDAGIQKKVGRNTERHCPSPTVPVQPIAINRLRPHASAPSGARQDDISRATHPPFIGNPKQNAPARTIRTLAPFPAHPASGTLHRHAAPRYLSTGLPTKKPPVHCRNGRLRKNTCADRQNR